MKYNFEEQPDLVLEEDDYDETRDGISIDKMIFANYRKDYYLNIKFADDNNDDIYCFKMVGEDYQRIYLEYIG